MTAPGSFAHQTGLLEVIREIVLTASRGSADHLCGDAQGRCPHPPASPDDRASRTLALAKGLTGALR